VPSGGPGLRVASIASPSIDINNDNDDDNINSKQMEWTLSGPAVYDTEPELRPDEMTCAFRVL
jgi:hypothetical protein